MSTGNDKLFIGAVDAAKLSGISPIRVRQLCQKGQVAGAIKVGERTWAIPREWRYQRPKMGRPKLERR
jgi:hypothetical protein